MTATITINMDNAAFGDNPAEELARILFDVSQLSTRDGGVRPGKRLDTPISDINGNTVGDLRIR